MKPTSRRGFFKGVGAAAGAAGLYPPQNAAAQGQLGGPRSLKITEIHPEHYKVRRKAIQWPNNARIAVTWVVNFEGKTDATTSNDIAATDYSCKAGFWRLLKIFEDNGVKGTWYTNGIIATRYPETLRELARLGHEIDGHNWANNIPIPAISPTDEREVVRRVFDDIEKACGVRPTGWMGSGEAESSTTMEFLVENGIIWNGDFSTDDVPYTVNVKGKKIVIIPYQRESNDTQISMRKYHPGVWLKKFKDQFDVMYEEGATYPQYLSAATHAWTLGHPAGSKAVEEAIQYAAGFPHVWNTTENGIAKYWLEQNYD
jgi:peptidoglycan/xylan/chitin deacetylase (PgdA/CDA1 family)